MSEVRTRFAPSPTGYLHVGGARTALFNWIFTKKMGGTLVLRIEDTDQKRNTEEAVQVIYDGLRWLGLDWNEGPQMGGNYGPYFQSQRNDLYEKHLKTLQDKGVVYEDEGSIRYRSPRQPVTVRDMVCGTITFDRAMEPDMTIRRPDGSWIFHFVNVVDDIEMKITHVLRGEDHLSNTPKHIELYNALGFEPPNFAHIPLILNRDGSKMSKRDDGASISTYIEQGYSPEAVRNYLCLLGWSPKDNREVIGIDEVVSLFDLEKINRRNAAFDLDKCFWINGQYIHTMEMDRFADLSIPFIEKAGIQFGSREQLLPVLTIVKEKIKLFRDVPEWISYFFTEDFAYDEASVEKNLRKPGALEHLAALQEAFGSVSAWDAATIEAKLKETAVARGAKTGELIHPTRVAASGRSVGPSLYHMLEVLGKNRVLARMEKTIKQFGAVA
ncbi:MAG: glutamate--tRNA ligase [Chthoniobacterales bacterium]